MRITVIYDGLGANAGDALHEPDNITVHEPTGHLFVAEDADDLQLVHARSGWEARPFLQLIGHDGSEVTGPSFSPDGTRLYVTSQRGIDGDGMTFDHRSVRLMIFPIRVGLVARLLDAPSPWRRRYGGRAGLTRLQWLKDFGPATAATSPQARQTAIVASGGTTACAPHCGHVLSSSSENHDFTSARLGGRGATP